MSADTRYLSRKFSLSAAAFLAGLALFIAGQLSSTEWIDFTRWIVGLYMVGNVGDTFVTTSKPGAA